MRENQYLRKYFLPILITLVAFVCNCVNAIPYNDQFRIKYSLTNILLHHRKMFPALQSQPASHTADAGQCTLVQRRPRVEDRTRRVGEAGGGCQVVAA